MSRLVLGVIGHVDHGKTSLVRALTGIDTDRLPEEKRRGISIALGFAHFSLGGDGVDLVDMPGHERFVRTMVSGATGIDAVLLVVAANEGVMPQTREHIHIAGLLGLGRAVLAVTKTDLVSAEQAAVAGLEAAEVAADAGLHVDGSVLTSTAPASGIDGLRRAIARLFSLETTPPPRARMDVGLPYLPVDRAFTVAGRGTVVTGTLRRGHLTAEQQVELVPSGRCVRVRGLQVHGVRVGEASPGERVAVNLRGVALDQVGRGVALAPPGSLTSSRWLTVQVRSVAAVSLSNGARLRLLYGTDELDARLRLLDRDALAPGESGLAQLYCAATVAVPAREHFILRAASPAGTVAGGMILDPETARLRRHAPRAIARLDALVTADPTETALLELAAAGLEGLTIDRLARLAGIAPSHAAATLRALPTVMCGDQVAVLRPAFNTATAALSEALSRTDAAMSREQLLAEAPGTAPAVLLQVLSDLVASGRVRHELSGYRFVRAERDRGQRLNHQALADRLAEQLRQGGLSPPDIKAIAADLESRRVLDSLVREGIAARGYDSGMKRDVAFHQDAIDLAKRVLTPLLAAGPGLLVTEVGAALGLSRKFTLPLLDHLDAIRFTRRVGDRRQLRERS